MKDVVGAAPTGDASTTSEWSPILLPTEVWLILEVWQYLIYLDVMAANDPAMLGARLIEFSWIAPQEELTHWGQVTHICVGKLTTIGSDNGLSPGWHQAIKWTNAEILLIGPVGTNFSEILITIKTFSLKKLCLKISFCEMLCISSWPQCVNTWGRDKKGSHVADRHFQISFLE